MATPVIKGNQLTGLTELEGSPSVEMVATGRMRTYRYACQIGYVEAALPQFDAIDPYDSSLRLTNLRWVRDGIVAIITAEYSTPAVQEPTAKNADPDADPVIDGDSNALEIPIEQHPSYSATWATTKAGVDSYLSPQPTATFTWYKEATPDTVLTEAVRVKNVGKPVNPAGVKTPTSRKWLKVGRRIRGVGSKENGNKLWEITESYQYGDNALDSDIYPDAPVNDYGASYLVGAL